MKFTDSIWINASSHKVWEYVGSLENWPRFYAKTGICTQVSPECGIKGSLYDMTSGLGSRSALTRCEIVDLHPSSMIAVKLTLVGGRIPRWMQGWACQVTYELKDEGYGTKVTERVEMFDSDLRIILFTKVFMWLATPFRKLAGKTYLQRLKGVVEGTR